MGGYVVTEAGREAADREDVCRCKLHIEWGMLVCEHCGTAWQLNRTEGIYAGFKPR
jgi:hypothetical protein